MIRELPERFWDKVQAEPNSGCWLWVGAFSNGYGSFSLGGRTGRRYGAHRVAYEFLVGPIPAGLQIDHLCRVRNCVNPDHMEPVTSRENTRRGEAGKATGRLNRAKSHCPQGHPFSGENLYETKSGGRACIACKRESTRHWRAKFKRKCVKAIYGVDVQIVRTP